MSDQSTRQRIPTYCALCISRCGCLAVVEDGRLIGVEPDPEHPTGKTLCIKAKAAPELVHHPDRLTMPLRRTRPKGEADPGWRAISWDEALDEIGDRLRAIGPLATTFAVTTPSGTAIADSFGWIHRLAHAFGSPNLIFATENCNWHKDFSPALTWGAGIGMPDYEYTDCILLWGFDPAATWLAQTEEIRRAQKRGARLVVIDPRGAGLARGADLWLAPRPGSDAALALGLIHLLLEGGHIDRDFLARHSDAFDPAPDGRGTVLERVAERAAGFPPERVAELTGIGAAAVRQAAQLIATCGPLSFFTWTGTCQQANATQTTRAINLLYALTGWLDAPGGNVWFAKPPLADIAGFELVDAATRQHTYARQERPLGPSSRGWVTSRDFFNAVLDSPVPHALVSFGGNFLLTKPGAALAEKALAGLDFFVQTELFHTPTTRWADLVLPVASCWERPGLQGGFMVSQAAESHVQLRPAVAAPPGEARADTAIVFAIARRLGLDRHFFGGDPAAGLAHVLAPAGLIPEALRAAPRGLAVPLATRYRKYESDSFATPSGKLQLWSAALAEAGHDPLPDYAPLAVDPRFPWRLTCGKIVPYCHSQQRNQPALRRHAPQPVVELAPDVAAAAGVADGEKVAIRAASGEMRAAARINRHLAAGTVWAQYGWWSAEEAVNYNDCSDAECFDPVAGSNALRGIPCAVERVVPDRDRGSAVG